MQNILIILVLVFMSRTMEAQRWNVVCDGSITFSYDASGNRVQRSPYCYVIDDVPNEPWPCRNCGEYELGLPNNGDPKSPESVTAGAAKSLGQEGAAIYAPTLVVFPNPTSGDFQVNCSDCQEQSVVRIVDATGREVHSGRLGSGGFSLNAYQPGVYTVYLQAASGAKMVKVVKQ